MRFSFKPPNRALMVELETERFILRPASRWEILRDPHGWRRTPHIYGDLYRQTGPMNLRVWLKKGPFPDYVRRFTSAIVPKGEDKPIGYHMVKRRGPSSAGFTAGIHDADWLGKDVAVEVRIAVMNHFFRHGIDRFNAHIISSNLPSIFTYRKLGYAYMGTRTEQWVDPTTGKPPEVLLFEMRKEDWMRTRFAEPGL